MRKTKITDILKVVIVILGRAVELLYPPCCPFCDQRLKSKELTTGICCDCQKKLVYITDTHCLKCGKPIDNENQEFCYDCGRRSHRYDQARALLSYQGQVRGSLYRFKYSNRREYVRFYVGEMERLLGQWIRGCRPDYLIPIPLHIKKEQERGYNQATLLAEELGSRMRIPCLQHVLIKHTDTRQQKELDSKARQKNLEEAFGICDKNWQKQLAGKRVMIIDDIYTTGATVDAAAAVLRRAGVSKIYVLTVAIGG